MQGIERSRLRNARDELYRASKAEGFGDPRRFGQLVEVCRALADGESCKVLVNVAKSALDAHRVDESIVAAFNAFMCQGRVPPKEKPLPLEEYHRLLRRAGYEGGLVAPPSRKAEPGDDRLRVAHIHSGAGVGHAPTSVVDMLVRNHDRRRFEPWVYLTDAWLDSSIRGGVVLESLSRNATVRIFRPPGSFGIEKTQELLDALAEDRIDIAVFHTHYCPVTIMAAMQRAAPLMVGFQHGGVIIGSRIDRYLVLGESGLKTAPRSIGQIAAPIFLGSDFHLGLESAEPATLDGVAEDAVRLGTVGHLYKYADETFLVALARVLESSPDSVWLFAGRRGGGDLERILSVLAAHGVDDQAHYLGQLDGPEVSGFLKALDVFVNSYPVPGALAVVEAMAAGLPVVSLRDSESAWGYTQQSFEYIGDESLVFDMPDTDGFVAFATRLAGDQDLRSSCGNAMRERYMSELTSEAMTRRVDALLEGWHKELVAAKD